MSDQDRISPYNLYQADMLREQRKILIRGLFTDPVTNSLN